MTENGPAGMLEPERRRRERRSNARVADMTIPEMRRLLVTTLLSTIVVLLFLYMVRGVIVAGVLGVIIGVYARPLYERFLGRVGRRSLAALLTVLTVIVPVLAALVYSYLEISEVARYVALHQQEIATQITTSVRKLPFMQNVDPGETVGRWVLATSSYGARLPGMLQRAVVGFSIAATIFLFTTVYILTDGPGLADWIRSKIPPRYGELRAALERSVMGVLYGAIYSTLLTQTLKSVIVLVMNLAFGVPLAAVLAIVSFIIGFFPIVGSWSVYVPVALWLLVFRGATVPAVVMLTVGFVINTLFISMYLRPKLAADRSRVLNFYWMLVALVTGVYTFGLAGILIGPILIGMLKAIIDTVTAKTGWRVLDEIDVEPAGGASA
ncbi:MAG TPA: AI-2E family transporter [Gemmatimonadaceae bacterium]|nr:AI-2E family transporter [Gemmatimonadaceae bacterium]